MCKNRDPLHAARHPRQLRCNLHRRQSILGVSRRVSMQTWTTILWRCDIQTHAMHQPRRMVDDCRPLSRCCILRHMTQWLSISLQPEDAHRFPWCQMQLQIQLTWTLLLYTPVSVDTSPVFRMEIRQHTAEKEPGSQMISNAIVIYLDRLFSNVYLLIPQGSIAVYLHRLSMPQWSMKIQPSTHVFSTHVPLVTGCIPNGTLAPCLAQLLVIG